LKKNENDKHDGIRFWAYIVGIIVGVVSLATGVNFAVLDKAVPQIAVPDRFTGTEGARLKEEIEDLRRRVDQLPPRQLQINVALLQHDLEVLEAAFDSWIKNHDNKYVPASYLQTDINRLEKRIEELENNH
jgi:polyhydroxyalkanoate synthesis regulator phasin